MKRILVILIATVFLSSTKTHAQEKVQTESGLKNDFIYKNSNVGIGTNSPKSKLTLGSDLSTMTSTKGLTLGVDENTIEFLHSESAGGYGSKIYGEVDGSGVTSMRFAVRGNTSTWTDAMYIRAAVNGSGKVGIGNTSPKSLLTLGDELSTMTSTKGLTLGVDENVIELLHSESVEGYGSKIYGEVDGAGVTSMRFAVRGNTSTWTDAMYIRAATSGTGRVGIGTTSPKSLLTLGDELSTMTSTKGLTLGVDENVIELLHSESVEGYGSKIYGMVDAPGVTSMRFAVRGNTSTWTDALYIRAGINDMGAIGIGTKDLDSDALRSIHSQEIKVLAQARVPDYVFKKDYDL